MEEKSRSIILKNKGRLAKSINLDRLKPFLVKHKIFSNAMLRDIFDGDSGCDFFIELLSRGPDAFCKFHLALLDAGYDEEAKVLVNSDSTRVPRRLCYKMISKPLGICKIINNVDFDSDYLSDRYGSDVDATSLRGIFSSMGYVVLVEKNLTAAMMRLSLENFAKHECWASLDSCIVIILSHGANINNQDVIYGTDSEFVDKMDIYEMFDNYNCRQLQDKPKIFVFQACRGDNEDGGVYYSTESTDAAKFIKRPTMSDTLVIHSALPNHKSYRDHVKGSWFCQDLVQVLSDDYLEHPLETMLQTVDRKIERRLSVKNNKQVTHIDKFGIKADIYFCLNNMTELPEFYIPKFN